MTTPRDGQSGYVCGGLEMSAATAARKCLSTASRHWQSRAQGETTQTGGCDPVAHPRQVCPCRVDGQSCATDVLASSSRALSTHPVDSLDARRYGMRFD